MPSISPFTPRGPERTQEPVETGRLQRLTQHASLERFRAGLRRPLEAMRTAFSAGRAPALPSYASAEGHFERAEASQVEAVRRSYLQSLETGLARPPAGEVSRVSRGDLAVDLGRMSPSELEALSGEGLSKLRSLYYFTSGAGLWSRGGGQVKALVPLNLSELLAPAELSRLSRASDLVNASSPEAVLFAAQEPGRPVSVPEGSSVAEVARGIVDGSRAEIAEILDKARADERALPPLALKLVNVALASKRAGSYIPFDVWTSEQTHRPISEFLDGFKRSYARRQFHPDAAVQAEIVGALREYFDAAAQHRDTHLFGYQRGLHALDPKTGEPLADTAAIGEGAGRAKAYLDESGRTAELLARGKEHFVFENIEVFNDLPLLAGAHGRGGRDVSVVLVEQRDGYTGGSPFLVARPDGTKNLELHEQSALPKEFATGNAFFNANTIYQPLDAAPPSGLGFEVKNNGTQVRAKQNAGDITVELPTAGIGGRIPLEYENLKTFRELGDNGVPLIDAYRELWRRDASAVKAPPASGVLDWSRMPR